MLSSNGTFIVPLAANFTTVNIPYNQMYSTLTYGLPVRIIRKTSSLSADRGYDDPKLNQLSPIRNFS
ncbi:MAG TPA: hypothetical protein VK250_07070 [Nitrososphaeraceae archaeon]|nr:hypothetical protein [Nitrososphaeraceae archaeon]